MFGELHVSLQSDQIQWQLLRTMDRLIESNLKMSEAMIEQTAAINALAASNEMIVNVLAEAALENAPADEVLMPTSLDQIVPEPVPVDRQFLSASDMRQRTL